MNKKKLFGTIIGVLAFILLIAGATFAALSAAATVTNGNYATNTKEFNFTYSGSNNISGAPILGTSATYSAMTNASTGKVTLTITKSSNSPEAGTFKLYFHINTNTLTTSALRYKVCAVTDCGESSTISGTTVSATSGDVEIYSSTGSENDFSAVGQISKTYYIYFWLDSETLVNDDINKSVSGYIYASATQAEI